MLKTYTFFLFILISLTCYSQDKLSVYKAKVDKVILNYFDKSLINKIKCTDVCVYGLDSSIIYFGDYETSKNNKEKLSSAIFFYSFFSRKLNYLFKFEVTINKSRKVQMDSSLFFEIPDCIAKKIECNYITKDSAIKIAIRDSISYPKNLDVELYKNFRGDNYFWFVTGYPFVKKKNRRNATKRSGTNYGRIINAISGEIISHKDYYGR